jgi:hypothetical protein
VKETDMQPDNNFPELSADFNASAKAFLKDQEDRPVAMLLAKYSALVKYKAQNNDEREALAAQLFDCGLKILESAAATGQGAPNFSGGRQQCRKALENTAAIFDRLAEGESARAVPEKAPDALGDVALRLVKKAEMLEEGTSHHYEFEGYRDALVNLAVQSLKYADSFKETAVGGKKADVTTAQDVTARRIMLKNPKDDGAAP